MKKYSQFDLMNEELSFLAHSTDFIGRMLYKMNKNTSISLKVQVPLNLYLRAEIFCEDIEELSERTFVQNDLITILYNDFLLFAKKNPNPQQLLKVVTSLDPKDKRIELVQESNKIFKAVHKQPMKKMQEFEVKLKRKDALRGEVLMADLEEVYPNHGYTVEHLIELLYVDCVESFKKKNNKEVFQKILLYLDHESS